MSTFQEISPDQLKSNPFTSFSKDWALITASDGERTNAMTIGWGGMGFMWGKNCTFVVIRPQRYTYELLEKSDCYSLTFFDERYRKELSFCGKESGRNTDKLKACGFTLDTTEGIPYIQEAKLVIACKKLYYQDLKPSQFFDSEIDSRWYPEKDYHRMYIGEIKKILLDSAE